MLVLPYVPPRFFTTIIASIIAFHDDVQSSTKFHTLHLGNLPKKQSALQRMQPRAPPATRHRSVMTLRKRVPLIDMRPNPPLEIVPFHRRRSSQPAMMVSIISTDRIYSLVEDDQYVELLVRFYRQEEDKILDENTLTPPEIFFKAVMPKDWTPRMYLGVLLTSIEKNNVLLLEPVMLNGRRYMTANEIHWAFTASTTEIEKRLAMSGAYLQIAGGQ